MERIGPYEVQEELARGGVGVIYLGRDPRLGRQVVLKLLQLDDDRSRARLDREAKAMAQLVHPHVVPLLDAGEHEGEPYLVLPYVKGESLQDTLDREGALSVRDTVRCALQISQGLSAVHAQGLVHRDLKPANLLLDQHGNALITDFGLVKDVSPEESRSISVSVRGRFLGTPGYWPPEQARGRLHEIGPHSDVYALGATLHALLTGVAPRNPGSMIQALECFKEPLPPLALLRPPGDPVPGWLEGVVRACLRNAPAERPELSQVLDWLRDEQGPAPLLPPPPATRTPAAPLPALPAPTTREEGTAPPLVLPIGRDPRSTRRRGFGWAGPAGLLCGLLVTLGAASLILGGSSGGGAALAVDASPEEILVHVEQRARALAPLTELLALLDRAQNQTREGSPEEAAVRLARADAYRRRGDYKGALSAAPVEVRGEVGHRARLIQGLAELRMGRTHDALQTLAKLAEADRVGRDGLQARAILAALRENREWIDLALRASRADPEDVLARSLAAYANSHEVGHAVAIAELRALRSEVPDDPLIAVHLAYVLEDSGDPEGALASFEDALNLAGAYAPAQIMAARAQVLGNLGRAAPTLEACERLVTAHPDYLRGHVLRGLTLEASGREELARQAFTRACLLAPEDPEEWDYMLRAVGPTRAKMLRELKDSLRR